MAGTDNTHCVVCGEGWYDSPDRVGDVCPECWYDQQILQAAQDAQAAAEKAQADIAARREQRKQQASEKDSTVKPSKVLAKA